MSKRNFFADDGWAVWLDGDDVSTFYIGEWLNPKGKSYMDIAIHTHGMKSVHSLNIYIPFSVTKEDLTDISLVLNDEAILYATFNAACIVDYMKNECTSELAFHGKTLDLVHISKLGFTLEPLANGTLFNADLDRLQEFLANDEAYFIFRLPHRSIDRVFKPKEFAGSIFERLRGCITTPIVAEKYAYSVRINEFRLLPPEINRIGSFHRQKLKRAVISVSVNEEYEVSDRGCYRIRRLEEQLYQDYVSDGFSCKDSITYQWEQTEEENKPGRFNFYFSIMRNSVSPASMLIYMILITFIGCFGSALWDLIKRLLGL